MTLGSSPEKPLSPREDEVMFWVSEGECDKEIAARFDISITTVLEYIHRSMEKLGTRKRTHAVKLWIRSRISRGLPWDRLT